MRTPHRRTRIPIGLEARLRAAAETLDPSAVDQVWIFPPLPDQEPAAEFLLFSCYDGAPDRRRVIAARVTVEPIDEAGLEVRWVQRLDVHGTAPRDILPRVADRLVRRTGTPAPPRVVEIGGAPERWEALLAELASRPADGADGGANGAGRVDTRPPGG